MQDQRETSDARRRERSLAEAKQRAARQWHALGQRFLTITPQWIGRALLVLASMFGILWVLRASWPATLPFLIGFVIAYIMLPAVNAMSRVMPRLLASLLATTSLAAILVATPIILIRPLVIELVRAYRQLPSDTDVNDLTDRINSHITNWPAPIQNFVHTQLDQAIVRLRDRIDGRIQGLDGAFFHLLTGAIGAIGLVLGIVVLPIWIHMVMKDQVAATDAINRRLPDWIEADFWAIVRIVDRAFGHYMRGLALLGLGVGSATFAGLLLLDHAGVRDIRYPLALATAVGVLELIPTFGPILAVSLVAMVGLRGSPETAIAIVVGYLGLRYLVRRVLSSQLDRALIDIHPAVLAVVIVAVSQFGIVWTLVAAPLTALFRDLFRYLHGRLSEPAVPAGIVPWERKEFAPNQPDRVAAAVVRRVPLVHQRQAAIRARRVTTAREQPAGGDR